MASSGRARERFLTCLRWASNASHRGYSMDALKAYSYAIEILPSVIFLGEHVVERIEALREVNGLATSSVAVALTLEDIPAAIMFMERTRGIIWLQSFLARSPQLHLLPAPLRDQVIRVNHELARATRSQWAARRRKAEELEQVICEIRALPGFERFQLPPSLDDIEKALGDRGGYAVIVIPSDKFCDIMVLGAPDERSHLRLSSLNLNQLRDMARAFATAQFAAREAERSVIAKRTIHKVYPPEVDQLLQLLAEMWRILVCPIVDHLKMRNNIQGIPDQRRRVWWCPLGPLGTLPLHAAGAYTGPSQDHVSNYIISSYIPSLWALERLLVLTGPHMPVSLTRTQYKDPPHALLIAQAESAHGSSLPNATLEVKLVQALIPPRYVVYGVNGLNDGVAVGTALAEARDAAIIHLACHGHQDQDDPLNSGFELKDGRLTLGQLMEINAPCAQMAYLSACESAGMDESRPDEGLNLVGSMIFAGFKSVIGTLWAMDDIDGPFMAKRVYARVFRDGYLDMNAVPLAVDEAVCELRKSGVSVSRWATYVHFGL